MKKILKYISCSAVALTAAALLPSCAMEEPFRSAGEGSLTIVTEINGDVIKTRADLEGDELKSLRDNCVIYIENNKGVIRKYKGVDNVPPSIKLQTGSYVAEAWSGDSVSASFSSKFYRGYEEFEIAKGENSLTLKCNIANVVASVNPESLKVNLSDLKVTFSHSRDSLVFDEEAVSGGAKGYFMMPNSDKDLAYRIEGVKEDGSKYVRTGVIAGVQRAHEYSLNITQNQQDVNEGGALIRIEIEDIPLIEEFVEIYPGPSVKGIGFNIDEQVSNIEKPFSDLYVYVRGYGDDGLSSVILSTENEVEGFSGEMNILNDATASRLEELGIRHERKTSVEAGTGVTVDEVFVIFSKDFLTGLQVSESEYEFKIEAVDSKHRIGSAMLRVVNSQDAVEVVYPVTTAPAPDTEADPLAVGARRATLQGIINDSAATEYGIMYHARGEASWTKVYAEQSRAARSTRAVAIPYSVQLSGLEPGTTYEYKAFSGDYESSVVYTFTTESVYQIPNASFEEWSTYTASTMLGNRSVILPGSTGDKYTSTWGSGNEGSATVSKTLTNKYDGLKRTGQYSARLASDQSAGILAAGNIFIGEYAKTVGTNGVLNVGRPYNGSHPSKVRVYCNYRAGEVDIVKDKSLPINSGDKDHGQIYVGLVSTPMELRTADKFLFTPEREEVIAYGEVTFIGDYGDDNELKEVEIEFNYNDKAKTQRPGYLVIVATAAKYGDYFSGSSKSVMILDDFELVYE